MQLRPVREEDFPALFAMYTELEAAWMAAFASDDPDDEPAFRRRWRRILHSQDVVARAIEVDGQLCGTVSMWPDHDVQYVGYWIEKSQWGRGLATSALQKMVMQAQRPVRAHVAFDNLASQAVLTKVGFRRIGHERGFANIRQQVIEEFVYELA